MANPYYFSKKQWQLINIVLFILVIWLAIYFLDLRDNFNLESIREVINKNKILGLIFFVLLFALGNFIQIPGMVFLAAAVITLGKINGGVVTYVAAVTSCVISFVIIRAIGGDVLRSLENKWANKIFHQLDQKPVRSIFILRLIFQTFPILTYGFALSRVKFKHHLIGTMLALPLPIFLYVLFFDYLARVSGII